MPLINTEMILAQFDAIMHDYHQVAKSISEADINTIPFAGSWTAGQLIEHLNRVNTGFAKLIAGPDEETTRDPLEKIEQITAIMLDVTLNTKAAPVVDPPQIKYVKSNLISTLEEIKKETDNSLQLPDIARTCTLFEVPVFGYLTRLEALHFINCHTQRHTMQLKNIIDKAGEMDRKKLRK